MDKLAVARRVSVHFCGIPRLIILCTRSHHWPLYWSR